MKDRHLLLFVILATFAANIFIYAVSLALILLAGSL